MDKNFELQKDTNEKKYYVEVEGKLAYVEYIQAGERVFLTHTEVPPAFEGKGVGSQLVRLVLEDIKKNDWTLVPLCPFIASYIKRHPAYKSLVLKGINVG